MHTHGPKIDGHDETTGAKYFSATPWLILHVLGRELIHNSCLGLNVVTSGSLWRFLLTVKLRQWLEKRHERLFSSPGRLWHRISSL